MPVPRMALVNKALEDAEASGSAKRVFDHFYDQRTQDSAGGSVGGGMTERELIKRITILLDGRLGRRKTWKAYRKDRMGVKRGDAVKVEVKSVAVPVFALERPYGLASRLLNQLVEAAPPGFIPDSWAATRPPILSEEMQSTIVRVDAKFVGLMD